MMDPLELDVQVVVRHHLAAENEIWVFCRRSKHFKQLRPLSSPEEVHCRVVAMFEEVSLPRTRLWEAGRPGVSRDLCTDWGF